ncbi:MAG: glycoside hydrolase family 2 protein [Aestuariivirga sp.]
MSDFAGHGEIDLAGTWRIVSADGKHRADYVVPGDVHSSLITAGVIPDPYIGRNEYDVRWVAEQEWVASRKFQWDGGAGPWHLDVDYLDTLAEIRINGKKVLNAANCFRRYQPDVTKALKRGENKIEIRFLSNVTEAAKRQKQQPYYVPYSNTNCPIPDGNMLRKPACHYGWDWNLAIAPFGAYGRMSLRSFQRANFNIKTIKQIHFRDGSVGVRVLFEAEPSSTNGPPIVVSFAEEKQTFKEEEFFESEAYFHIKKPKLWWPADSGEQHLYELKIECGGLTETRQLGLRHIDLIATKDKVGARFAFKVNGKEIFCRGANWIPADALPSRATPELTRKLLQAAVDANMNMIRVWGGGYYEQDWFYDLCDELGLMVWQDFQFSCNLYPATEEFLTQVSEEVAYQVHRLHHHACIALWCGDNELIGALTWFEESRKNRDRYLVAYDRLNRTIEQAAKTADPNINWWPSSPSSGLMNFGDAWHDDRSGDMHFWSVWHEGKNFEHYRDVNPRFCSEFGFQSYPSLHVVKKFATGPDDFNIASAVMESHQKNTGGNARIAETMFRYFRFPSDFGNFCYLSQVQQGLAMKTAVEYWRSLKPHCMGTLYWQLNDTWPVASWSGLDHGGGWKAMHYMARRFYSSVAVMALPDKGSGGVIIKAVNDRLEKQKLSLDLVVLDPSGWAKPFKTISATLPPDRAVDVVKLKKGELPAGHILIFDFEAADGSKGRVHFANEPYKALNIANPALTHSAKIKDGSLAISLKAKLAALFVMAETGVDGRYSDNVLDLLPGESAEIIFTPDIPAELQTALDNLIIRDLYSSSH